jgi:endonuclease YncB( thermonuclease family)
MASTKTKLTLSIDSSLVKRLHQFLEENPGHPSISSVFEQSMSSYLDYFDPVFERLRSGDTDLALSLVESGLFRTISPIGSLINEFSKIRTQWEEEKKKNNSKSIKKTKKKSV